LKTTSHDSGTPPLIILDTNVVLDWLLFRNAECERLGAWLLAGRARWLSTAAMRDELTHVLARGRLDKWQPQATGLWSTWDTVSIQTGEPAPASLGARLRCTDTDDQKFIDLALASGARWLLSRDRAVLKLARRARAHGLEIQTPGAWVAARRLD
jgi:predicted nucleic acid-binding protein